MLPEAEGAGQLMVALAARLVMAETAAMALELAQTQRAMARVAVAAAEVDLAVERAAAV
jgi:hypothetical protein